MRPPARLAAVALATAILMPAAPLPASAMCGGNIFATCPPAQNAAAVEAAKAKREKRLQSVREKKRHYPLLKH